MSDDSMKKANEQLETISVKLEEMPEIDESRLRRRPGRGNHVDRCVSESVVIDPEFCRISVRPSGEL